MTGSVMEFYDDLAEEYHLIFADWNDAIERQSIILDQLIRSNLTSSKCDYVSLFDCSCGIGTQAIGLAKKGYAVTATDLSPASIRRAKREAESRGIQITFSVADLRSLRNDVPGEFEVVLSADNALPHLLSDMDLILAIENIYAKVRPGGLLVLTIRDYDLLLQDKPRVTQPRVYDGGKRIVFQVWDWETDSSLYTVNQFVVQKFKGVWETKSFSTDYRALQRHDLSTILGGAGFTDVKWHMPGETGYYQPIVTASKE